MKKIIRLTIGGLMTAFGIIFFILPGSMFVLIGGLFLLSYDWPRARTLLGYCQKAMQKSAHKLDRALLSRKLR